MSYGEVPGASYGRKPARINFDNLSKLAKQEECLRYLLTGHSLRECAQLVGVSYNCLTTYVREPKFTERLKALSTEVYAEVDKQIQLTKLAAADRINEISMKALDRMEAIIEKGGDNVAYKAAQDILDRNPEVPRNRRVEGELTQRVFDPAALLHAANVARELDNMDNGGQPITIEGEQVG